MKDASNTSKVQREDAVYYEDFMHLSVNGNDYPALKAAHDYANSVGKKVIAEKNKSYTITDLLDKNGNYSAIKIKTDVDFGNAKILIDDTHLTSHLDPNNLDVFSVVSEYDAFFLSKEEIADIFPNGIVANSLERIKWKYNFPAMLVIINEEQRVYKRFGSAVYNDNPKIGHAQTELVVIDKDGNVDPETTVMFDYSKVTDVKVFRIDEQPITITGGIFTTKASSFVNKVNGVYRVDAIHRGFCAQRSNVTFMNVAHYVTNEVKAHPKDLDKKGAGYDRFFMAQNASDVTFENCIFTARRYYSVRGSYDITANTANRVIVKNCTQSNFYVTDEYVLGENGNPTKMLSVKDNWYWGVCGSSGCKNFIYDGSVLSRYDSHTNLYNGKIINSKITRIQLIGCGDMLIENTEIVPAGAALINLRMDYGATWRGNITMRNCRVQNDTDDSLCIVYMPWKNHDFGIRSTMPNVAVDNLTLARKVPLYIFRGCEEELANKEYLANDEKNLNPLNSAEYITVYKCDGDENEYLLKNYAYLSNTQISDSVKLI